MHAITEGYDLVTLTDCARAVRKHTRVTPQSAHLRSRNRVLRLAAIACTQYDVCHEDYMTTATDTTTQEPTPAPLPSLDNDVSAAAEHVVRQAFVLGPEEPFTSYECHSDGALCWAQYITGFTFNAGVLRVALQVDRSEPFGKEVAEKTARAVRNFIKAEHDPVFADVDWVVATDGTGVQIAQESM